MLSDRLRTLRRERALTQKGLAERLGITQQAIAKWEGGRAVPEPATIVRLADLFEVSADYLLGVSNTVQPAGQYSGVQVMGSVRAGYGALPFEEPLGVEPAAVKEPDAYRYLMVRGDSMEPLIRAGDLALVRLQPTLQNGELGVFIYGDEEATLKRYRQEGDTVILEPFNDAYAPITIQGSALERLIIFGRVVETHSKW